MKSIGEYFKSERIKKRYTISDLEEKTKIKKIFIDAIENEQWENLPEYPVVLGFVKNVAGVLGVDVGKAVAFLRRDYPPKILPINPKPDVSKEFVWSPKLTFITSIVFVSLMSVTYLVVQYKKFVSPPSLEVDKPKEGQEVALPQVLIEGKTDVDAIVTANNQPVIIDSDGNFSFELEINEQTDEIIIVAKSRSGKQTIITRRIKAKE